MRAAALPIGLVALALGAVAARMSGRARICFAGAGVVLGLAAVVILLLAR